MRDELLSSSAIYNLENKDHVFSNLFVHHPTTLSSTLKLFLWQNVRLLSTSLQNVKWVVLTKNFWAVPLSPSASPTVTHQQGDNWLCFNWCWVKPIPVNMTHFTHFLMNSGWTLINMCSDSDLTEQRPIFLSETRWPLQQLKDVSSDVRGS